MKLKPWNKGLKTGRPSEQAVNDSAKGHYKKILRIDPTSNEQILYDAAILAEKDGFNSSSISLCCKHPHKYKSHKGYFWSYYKDFNNYSMRNIKWA